MKNVFPAGVGQVQGYGIFNIIVFDVQPEVAQRLDVLVHGVFIHFNQAQDIIRGYGKRKVRAVFFQCLLVIGDFENALQGEGVSAFKAEERRKEKTRRIFMFGANQNGFVVPVCLCQVAGLLLQLPEIDGFRGAQVKDGVILTLKSIVLVLIENYFHLFFLFCCFF